VNEPLEIEQLRDEFRLLEHRHHIEQVADCLRRALKGLVFKTGSVMGFAAGEQRVRNLCWRYRAKPAMTLVVGPVQRIL